MMADYLQTMNFPSFYPQEFGMYQNQNIPSIGDDVKPAMMPPMMPKTTVPEPPPPPPVVICPTEVDTINVTLEKNQQCACKDCGKLFNSVWYLKQHAVKHSNDRPFKCKFCFKTYKFRSNLYQHKCPDRQRNGGQGRRLMRGGVMMSPSAKRSDTNQLLKSKIEASMGGDGEPNQSGYGSDNEENDAPIHYGPVILHENTDVWQPPEPVTIKIEPPPAPPTCIREQQLKQEDIDSYLLQHKNKIHTCRKCRLMFPSSEALLRHSGVHDYEDVYYYNCMNCREVFTSEKELRRHSQVHSDVGPWRCQECCGTFRSNVALRKHQENSRECFLFPFGIEPEMVNNDLMYSPIAPLDPFSFIISAADQLVTPTSEELARGPDSGLGSDSSPHSFSHHSPARSSHTAEEELEERIFGKKKDDDEDSGFRSRLNSVNQSCSPGSSSHLSSEEGSGSPQRKMSAGHEALDCGFTISGTGYGSGPAYGTMMIPHFEQSMGGGNGTLSFTEVDEIAHDIDSYPFATQFVDSVGPSGNVLVAPQVSYHTIPRISKEMFVESRPYTSSAASSSNMDICSDFADGFGSPQESGDPVTFEESDGVNIVEALQAIVVSAVMESSVCALYVNIAISLLTAAAAMEMNGRTED